MKNILKKQLTQTQSYFAGFVFSIVLTLIPYWIVVNDNLSGDSLLLAIMGYAFLQVVVQMVFFLHLGQESKPRWKLISIIFMSATMLFIGIGTLWIMKNLDYNMTMEDPKKTQETLIEDQNIKTAPQEDHTGDNHDHNHGE
jgi:cytochrome o ubiquinol oxidase operon protein cyoD